MRAQTGPLAARPRHCPLSASYSRPARLAGEYMQRLFLPIIALAALLLFPANHARAAAQAATVTDITSQFVEYDTNAQTVIFTVNVHVVRPDIEIWSDKLTVVLKRDDSQSSAAPADGFSASQVERIIAEGSVRMKMGDRRGEAQKVTYTTATETVVMEGTPYPRLYEGNNTVTGRKITFYMAENRSRVEGSPDTPVRMTFEDNQPAEQGQ